MQVSAAAAVDAGGGDRFDAEENRVLGRADPAQMYRRYGSWPDAVAAYNWGPGHMDLWISGGRPFDKFPLAVEMYRIRVLVGSSLGMPRRGFARSATPTAVAIPDNGSRRCSSRFNTEINAGQADAGSGWLKPAAPCGYPLLHPRRLFPGSLASRAGGVVIGVVASGTWSGRMRAHKLRLWRRCVGTRTAADVQSAEACSAVQKCAVEH